MEFPGSKTTEVPKSDGRSEIERMLLGCHRMCEELSVYGIGLLFGDAVVPRPQRRVRGSQESGEPLGVWRLHSELGSCMGLRIFLMMFLRGR